MLGSLVKTRVTETQLLSDLPSPSWLQVLARVVPRYLG